MGTGILYIVCRLNASPGLSILGEYLVGPRFEKCGPGIVGTYVLPRSELQTRTSPFWGFFQSLTLGSVGKSSSFLSGSSTGTMSSSGSIIEITIVSTTSLLFCSGLLGPKEKPSSLAGMANQLTVRFLQCESTARSAFARKPVYTHCS